MTGAKYRPLSLRGKTRYYNILFLVKTLSRLDRISNREGKTRAQLVREAVDSFLEKEDRKKKRKKPVRVSRLTREIMMKELLPGLNDLFALASPKKNEDRPNKKNPRKSGG